MSAVGRDVSVSYGGKSYSLSPSNRLLRRIEGEVGSIMEVMSKTASAKPPVSEVAFIVSELLIAAQVPDVDEDVIYQELMEDLLGNKGVFFGKMCELIGAAITPPSLDPKKQPAPAKSRKKAGAKG
jgi:hypothetical protein